MPFSDIMPEPGRPMGPVGVKTPPALGGRSPEMRVPWPPPAMTGEGVGQTLVAIGTGKYAWATAYEGPGKTLTCVYSHDAGSLAKRITDNLKLDEIRNGAAKMAAEMLADYTVTVRLELKYDTGVPAGTRNPKFTAFKLSLEFKLPEKLKVLGQEALKRGLEGACERVAKIIHESNLALTVDDGVLASQLHLSLSVKDIPEANLSFIEQHIPTYVKEVVYALRRLGADPEVADPLRAVIRDSAKKGIAEVEASRKKS